MLKGLNMNTSEINRTLLLTWCDKIEKLQIKDSTSKGLFGGILCEGCGYIHGRCADVIYPMVTSYKISGDEKFLDCAERVFYWQKNNVRKNNGFNVNDSFNTWLAVTEFYQISLGSTLLELKSYIPNRLWDIWLEDFISVSETIYQNKIFIYKKDTYIAANYIIAYLASMAIAYKITGDQKYKDEALRNEATILSLLTEDGHFYGEAGGFKISKSGHRNIDLGYNVEESIGNFSLYAHLLERKNVLLKMAESLKASAEFMLPDGAWDNSWGSRAVKWTYYGSRTSDGAQLAFGLLAKYNPLFSEMCSRNSLLMLEMTQNGLLTGGKMYSEADIEPCAHHSFTHAKAAAYIVNNPIDKTETTSLIRENEYGIKHVESAGVTLISFGKWRATLTNTEQIFAGNQTLTGGSISLLYHMDKGVVSVGNGYKFSLVEPTNMQIPMDIDNICQTLRFEKDGMTSMLDNDAKCDFFADNTCITYQAQGNITDLNGNKGEKYRLEYRFEKDKLTVTLKADTDGRFVLPLVCSSNRDFILTDNVCTFNEITVEANKKLMFKNGYYKNRIFNTAGGFMALPLYIDTKANEEITLTISTY